MRSRLAGVLAVLVVAGAAFVVATTVVPAHITLGAWTLRCGTVLHPDVGTELGGLCARATAHHLRLSLVVAGVIAVLAVPPLLFPMTRRASAIYVTVVVLVALTGVAWLAGFAEYSLPRGHTFEL